MRYKDYLKKEIERLEIKLDTEKDLERKIHIQSEIKRLKTRCSQDVRMSSYGVEI